MKTLLKTGIVRRVVIIMSMLLTIASTFIYAAEEESVNNGTDPTRLTTIIGVQYTYSDLLIDDSISLYEFSYTVPIGEEKRMSLKVNVPYTSGVIDDSLGLGDASVKFTHVVDINKERGIAYTAEVFFDTASRDELGTGQTVLKASVFYAKFFESGDIFAPALVQQFNLSNNNDRSSINNTTMDFYYVPKLDDPNYFMTWDPAVTYDWENEKKYASLSVTFGRMMGKVFGGNSQVFIKPQILAGYERPIDWSIQVGYKVLGF